ncbi:MAG: hypothetical protein L0Y66_15300 [Myxococcaceae bacterium]|nr:hypothetical protein [Myxococcaceae bacterium]MCI0670490.1 hypothetical protein [Myxococcaceae bacterium]
MPTLLDSLPALYRGLFPASFHKEVPVEEKATCARCAMCKDSGAAAVESVDGVDRFFRPDTKCCTFHPRLPNYLLGALLSDERPELAEGRRRIEEKLASRVGVGPQFLRPPAKYALLYSSMRGAFGRAGALVCPYYDTKGGGCTVWPYREAVCSTWFCKYVAAEDGRRLWTTVKTYLTLAEIQLSRYALLELLPDYLLSGRDKVDPTHAPLRAEDLDEQPLSEKEYRELWGAWVGREAELYRASYELVRKLSPEAFQRVMGLDGVVELRVLEARHAAATATQLPKVLKLNPSTTMKWLPDGSVALGCYSEYEGLALPGEAYALLVEFTGKEPVEAVRERLRETKQADLGPDVLRALYQHRILTEA